MQELDATQVEQLRQIGEYLSAQRQERSISLEEVAVKTYIPLRLLQALEQGQIERLPEPVYIQGFIRRYADALGLDGSELSKTFVTEPAPVTSTLAELEPIAAAPPAQKIRTALSNDRDSQRPYLPLVVGGAAVLVLGIGAATVFNRSKPTPAPTAPAATQPARQQRAAAPIAKPSPPIAPVQVTVEAVEEAWMAIETDSNPAFEGILKQGEKKTWTAQKSLKLVAGNAGGVKFSYNQSEPKLLGARGETAEITLPPGQPGN